MPPDNPSDTSSSADGQATEREVTEKLALAFSGEGWVSADHISQQTGRSVSEVNRAIRHIKRELSGFTVETRTVGDEGQVRICEVTEPEKLARQMAADVVELLACLYVNVKHDKRSRKQLGRDVDNIARRMQPYLNAADYTELKRKRQRKLRDRRRKKMQLVKSPPREGTLDSTTAEPIEKMPEIKKGPGLQRGAEVYSGSRLDFQGISRVSVWAFTILLGLGMIIAIFFSLSLAEKTMSRYLQRINQATSATESSAP